MSIAKTPTPTGSRLTALPHSVDDQWGNDALHRAWKKQGGTKVTPQDLDWLPPPGCAPPQTLPPLTHDPDPEDEQDDELDSGGNEPGPPKSGVKPEGKKAGKTGSVSDNTRSRAPPTDHNMPLLLKRTRDGNESLRRVPFGFSDLSAIASSLSPVRQGGDAWVRAMKKATAGTPVTKGDVTAILSRALTTQDHEAVTRRLGWYQHDLSEPITNDSGTQLADVMRDVFPVPPAVLSDLVYIPKPGQDPTEFLSEAIEKHAQQTGGHPSVTAFHDQVLRGAPSAIKFATKHRKRLFFPKRPFILHLHKKNIK